ncbi:hypothetical protein [Kitasatospora sp. LaBMicrA B282]|uniref:hypothetical protein n=1 Tax=Kitasatospora sp. LaBMicrA B282 TaxID=3420949 RepID=UPI003D0ED4AB
MRRTSLHPAPALLLTAAALVTLTAGCSAGPAHSGTATTPQPRQATAVATEEFGLLAGGGWAQAWSLWDPGARQTITQADFVRLNTECRPALGTPYVIDRSATLDATTVQVDWHRAATATGAGTGTSTGASGSNTVRYQGGRWTFVPDPATLAGYRLGVDRLVQQRRAAGACH